MRIQRSTLAVAATVLTFAGGGGVAWACGAGSSYPGGPSGTTGDNDHHTDHHHWDRDDRHAGAHRGQQLDQCSLGGEQAQQAAPLRPPTQGRQLAHRLSIKVPGRRRSDLTGRENQCLSRPVALGVRGDRCRSVSSYLGLTRGGQTPSLPGMARLARDTDGSTT